MSDHEETSLDTGYSTPVPELDDHRHQSASVQRTRSRRGTVETMHSVNAHTSLSPDLGLVNSSLLHTIARDFEEAVTDEDSPVVSPRPGRGAPMLDARSRRGTVTTIDARSVSPPNSVKAFADARRRERELSNAEPISGLAFNDARRLEDSDLHRTTSSASRISRQSHRNRRYTNENDAKSFASNKSAEEDVCFPLHSTANKDTLQIDFDVLENFIAEEESREALVTKQPLGRVFHDLRAPLIHGQIPTIVTSDGNVVEVPSHGTSAFDEKDPAESSDFETFSGDQVQRLVENRFEFFSSLGESTIHAAEFGDLVLPGEDVRNLFTLPAMEGQDEDGVWWLNMNNPTEEEIRTICKAFGVHPLTIEDISTQEAREKIELFPSYYFACFRSFNVEQIDGGQEYEPFNIYVVVFREGTLSFSFSPNTHAAQVRKRITMLKDYVALSSDWICYALM